MTLLFGLGEFTVVEVDRLAADSLRVVNRDGCP